jgi:hypothetical protein
MRGVFIMSISLANKLAKDKFFLPPSKYINHKVVEIISLNDETEMVSVILQKYGISRSANAVKGNLITMELPYSEFKNLNGWGNNK